MAIKYRYRHRRGRKQIRRTPAERNTPPVPVRAFWTGEITDTLFIVFSQPIARNPDVLFADSFMLAGPGDTPTLGEGQQINATMLAIPMSGELPTTSMNFQMNVQANYLALIAGENGLPPGTDFDLPLEHLT